MIKYFVYILLFLTGFNAFSQSDYRFRNYTINNGLSQSSVTTIIQDELNSLWVGTQDGLNRYNGTTFEIFTSDESKGLESEYILCSTSDKKGNLWFGTSKGLTRYDLRSESFHTYTYKKGVAFHIQDIVADESGHLWLASAESGIYKFDINQKKFLPHGINIPSKKITNIALTKKNDLVISTDDSGIYLCDLDKNRVEKLSIEEKKTSNLIINKIVSTGKEKVLIVTNQGAFELNVLTKKIKPKFIELDEAFGLQNISDIIQQEGIGWLICTNNNGLFIIDEKGAIHHSTEDIFQKTALLSNQLNSIYKDGSGTFWIGSQRGLSNFNPLNKSIIGVGPSGNPERGIPTSSVWSIDEDDEAKYTFIGTDAAVSRLNNKTGKFEQYYRDELSISAVEDMAVLALEVINPNKVLVGCTDGLFELNIAPTHYSFKRVGKKKVSSARHNRIYSILHWKENLYWIATKDGALLYDNKKTKVDTFEYDMKLPDQTISKGICRLVYKDLNDRIWFTTSSGGLNILSNNTEGEMVIRPYEFNSIIKSASAEYITSIYQEVDGVYWMGTLGSGLIKWNERNKQTTVYNKTHGLPNDVIYSVLPGDKGSLWLSTNKGLCNINTKTGRVKNYTEVDGLMSNEFNIGAFMLSKTGIIYFGGIYGYNYFNPNEITRSKKDIAVVLTKFKLENEWLKPNVKDSPLKKAIFLADEINLSYKQRSFTIAFQSSDLSNPELINYKYILEGSDEGEILIGSMNEIHFNALSHGEYDLKIYARLGDGKWSSYPASIRIIIATPFWFTWWFWVVVGLVLAISIRLFIRGRIEASRREQVRLEMKIRDRTKEIQKQSKKIEAQNKKIEEERNKVLKQQRLLQIEKDKTERLLKNIIPESTAEELKKTGKARARAYKAVSVIFTDFVGFTKISENMSATELVKKLDVYFTKFDEIIVRNNLEKIKTIGDAYMCAGGVPVRNKTNPIDACLAALQIQNYMLKRKNDAIANGREYWELRLGVNTGEVVAGVIGSERLAYDIWGATVNRAQRMEMLGEPEKVTITGETFGHIEPYFECTFLGKAQTKSKDIIDMYVVERIKPELSLKEEGVFPNEKFNEIVNLHHYSSINYYNAERHIMKVLEQRLSKNLYYHSITHTKNVVAAVERIALLENVTDEGLFLLKSAATYHDAGFIEKYDNNEPIGARLADEILPKYGYTPEHIEQIKELIYVTEIPHTPKNKLEEIICDADLDYLGTDNFHEIADKLRRELQEHGKIDNKKQWDEIQVSFLTSHKYFTKTAKKTRNKFKAKNLIEVKLRLKKNDYED